jgi:hypothetical protein
MTKRVDDPNAIESVRSSIQSAFPDFIYSGPITVADGKSGEDYDEPEALYNALHGRSWSEISASFIRGNPHGLVLLTAEAFVAYLPAWLIEGLSEPEVAEVMVYTFSPEDDNDQRLMEYRMLSMNSIQMKALSAFLTRFAQTTSSQSVKDSVAQALVYVRKFATNKPRDMQG